MGPLVWEKITFGTLNPRGWSYRLCTRAATIVIIDALVGAEPAFPWFRGFISGHSFAILCAFGDSRSLMQGNEGVHCVWVSLTGTTMESF